MKKRNRLFAILLSAIMAISCMPAMVFAQGEDPAGADEVATVEEAEANAVEEPAAEMLSDEGKAAVSADAVEKVEMLVSRDDAYLLYVEQYEPEIKSYLYFVIYNSNDTVRVYTSETDFNTYKYSEEEQRFVNTNDSSDKLDASNFMVIYETKRIETGKTYNYHTGVEVYGGIKIDGTNFDFAVTLSVSHDSDADLDLLIAQKDALRELKIMRAGKYNACRAAQQDELDDIYDWAENTIMEASSIDEINSLKATAEAALSAVKTDAQMRAEEAAKATAAQPPAPIEIVDLPTVKISKPAVAKKKITVKWKKVSKKDLKKISGIQIQVATDPDFVNIVKTATAGKKKTSKVIKGLQSKTKYYVRIRAYAAGDHYSGWKSKSAKVK